MLSKNLGFQNNSINNQLLKLSKEIAQIRKEIFERDREKVIFENEAQTLKNDVDDMKEECKRTEKKITEMKKFLKMLKSSLLVVNKRTTELKYSYGTMTKYDGKAEKQLNFIFNHYMPYANTKKY